MTDARRTASTRNDESYVGPSEVIATPVFHEGRVYVAIGQDPAHGNGVGMLHCIDATQEGDITKTGCIWTYRDIQRTIATAAVADGVVYVPDLTGKIHGVDAETGQRRWLYDTNAETWGGAFVADGKLYLGNQRSFYIFTAGNSPEVAQQNPAWSACLQHADRRQRQSLCHFATAPLGGGRQPLTRAGVLRTACRTNLDGPGGTIWREPIPPLLPPIRCIHTTSRCFA